MLDKDVGKALEASQSDQGPVQQHYPDPGDNTQAVAAGGEDQRAEHSHNQEKIMTDGADSDRMGGTVESTSQSQTSDETISEQLMRLLVSRKGRSLLLLWGHLHQPVVIRYAIIESAVVQID